MNEELSAGVDRIIAQAAKYAIYRDESTNDDDRKHWDHVAAGLLSAACIAAEAGGCDNSSALSHEERVFWLDREPTAADYRTAFRTAVEENRR